MAIFKQANAVLLVVSFFLGTQGFSATGYFVAARGNLAKMVLVPDFGQNSAKDLGEWSKIRYGVGIVTGYLYGLPKIFAFGTQMHVDCFPQVIPLKKNWNYTVESRSYQMEADLSLKNRYSFGADGVIGVSIAQFFVYGLCGFRMKMTQIRGFLSAKPIISDQSVEPQKAAIYFGEDSKDILGIHFDKIKPPMKFNLAFVVGGGVRFEIFHFFIGVEFCYQLPRKRTMKIPYAQSDADNIFGWGAGVRLSDAKKKMDITTTQKGYEGGLLIGFKL
jgi:hypothetical protein